MKKPKIAFIHPGIGESLGGSQVFVLELAKRLRDKYDVTILCSKKENELCKPVFSISRGKLAKTKFTPYKLFRNFAKKFVSTPDVVVEHFSSFFPVLFDLIINKYDVFFPNNDWGGLWVSSFARKINRTPIIFTEHNGFLDEGKVALRNLKFKPDKYIVLSRDLKFWIEKYYPECGVEYVPNGVDLKKFNPDVPPKELDLSPPVVLTVSRNRPNKRLELIIDAVARLKGVSLLMLISGKNFENLKAKGEKVLGKNRFKLIEAKHYEMPSYYNSCDLFTLPSLYEPFGLVYLEAMACNKPVIAPSDISRIDIVGEAGILTNVSNLEEYANAIDKALKTDFKDIPRKQAEKYSWENTSKKYQKEIESLILYR